MAEITIKDISPADEYYVGCCTHINESEEMDRSSKRRINWFHTMYDKGLKIKVAILDNKQVGFAYSMPIETCPCMFIGEKLLAIPCLFVEFKFQKLGIGKMLLNSIIEEADRNKYDGIVTDGFYVDWWYMPAPFFLKHGFEIVQQHESRATLILKFRDSVKIPELAGDSFVKYTFKPIEDKVVVDLFWNPFCFTSDLEAERVREVVAEYGGKVILNDYNAAENNNMRTFKSFRAIYINGVPIKVGEETSKKTVRNRINEELLKLT
ncbi:MAG: GNAT family N-acetyltransferase [Fibrobacteres bacterium]|nr:GNAT family N-acetyltransferase [Fibrobacterota bacterium]